MAMDDDEVKQVQQFLRSKGYIDTELALLVERARHSANYKEVSRTRSVDDPSRLRNGYSMLREWVYGSMEPYKDKLHHILYPVFAQCFATLVKGGHRGEARLFFNSFFKDHEKSNSGDLDNMQRILTSLSQDMDLGQSLKGKKIRVELCEYSYELLIRYLHKEKALVMLEVINEGTVFEVSAAHLDTARLVPLKRETVAEIIKAGSVSALLGGTTLNFFAVNVSACHHTFGFFSAFIQHTIPYVYLPFGLVSAAIGLGAAKNHRLLDWAASLFVAQCLYILVIGGIRAITCRSMSFLGRMEVLTIVSLTWFGSMLTLLFWGIMSEHPKCLHYWANRAYMVYRNDFLGVVNAICMFPRKIAHWRIFARAAQTRVDSQADDIEMGAGQRRDQEGLAPGWSKKQ